MTQIFANISSLAEFLVAQKDQAKPAADNNSPVTGFEDFLSGQMTLTNLPLDIKKSSDFGINSPENVESFVVSPRTILGLPIAAKPPVEVLAAKSDPAIMQMMAESNLIPSESITPIQMLAGKLKALASQQNIPITLTLNPAELESILDVNTSKGMVVDNFQTETPINLPQSTSPQALQDLPEFATAIQPLVDQMQAAQPKSALISTTQPQPSQPSQPAKIAKLTLDAAKIIQTPESTIQAKLVDDISAKTEIQVKVPDLIKLINSNQESIIVQIKSDTGVYEPKTDLASFTSSTPELKLEKSYLVKLTAITSAKDSDSIGVLQKIARPETIIPAENRIESAGVVRNTTVDNRGATLAATQAEIVVPVANTTDKSASVNRKPDTSKAEKVASQEQQSTYSKLSDQEIQPIQSTKSNDSSMANIFGREQGIDQLGANTTHAEKALQMGEPSTLIAENLKIFNQIKSQLQLAGGNTQLTIQLKPESLGKVKVELKTEGDKLNAIFRVDNADVKRVLDAELPNLKHDWKIDSFRVETNARNAEDGSGAFGNKHNQARTSDGRSSGLASKTHNANDGLNGKMLDSMQARFSSTNSRIDFFA
jgi:flagellar hook-length control protein FliK